jgi:hypothetical protein
LTGLALFPRVKARSCSENFTASAFGGVFRRHLDSDAEVVGAPFVDDFLDVFFGEVFVEGAFDQGWELVVGGEAEGDDLADGEGLAAG